MVFPSLFPLASQVLGFLHLYFPVFFPIVREGFFGFNFLCFEILLYIFPVLPLSGLGFMERDGFLSSSELFGDEYLLRKGKCYT